MKKVISVFLLTFLIKFSIGQSPSIVGAWYWGDSTKQISMFFKQDGSMSAYSGKQGGLTFAKDLLKGTYILTNNILIITWEDKRIEKNKIEFLNSTDLKISDADKKSKILKTLLIFNRVVDEEVREEKVQ